MVQIGTLIKALMAIQGINNRDVAQHIGVHESVVCRICNGEATNESEYYSSLEAALGLKSRTLLQIKYGIYQPQTEEEVCLKKLADAVAYLA